MTLTTTMFHRSEAEMLARPFLLWSEARRRVQAWLAADWLVGWVAPTFLFDCCGLRRETKRAVFPEPADDVHLAGMAVKAQDQRFFAV